MADQAKRHCPVERLDTDYKPKVCGEPSHDESTFLCTRHFRQACRHYRTVNGVCLRCGFDKKGREGP